MYVRAVAALLTTLIFATGCTASKYAAGDAHYQDGEYNKAVEVFEAAAAANPDDAQVFVKLGDALMKQKEFERAATAYRTARRIDPESGLYAAKWADARFAYGNQLHADGNYRSAIEVFESLDTFSAGNPEYMKALGGSHQALGRQDNAADLYRKALAIAPDDETTAAALKAIEETSDATMKQYREAEKLYKNEMYYEATEMLKKVIEEKKDFSDARYLLNLAEGRHFLRRGKVAHMWEAIEAFGLANTIKPERQETVFYMAQAYEKKDDNEFDMAIDTYKKAAEMDPGSAMGKAALAKVKELTEKKEKYEKFFKKKKGGGGY